jgi:hypothetical protein
MASGMQMLAGGSLLLLLALTAGDFQRLNLANASWRSLASVVYLTVFGSLVAFTAYSWLLRNVTTARAATYAYVNPVVAVLLGWLFASEPLTQSQFDLTFSDKLRNNIRLRPCDLRFDRVADSELLNDTSDMNAALFPYPCQLRFGRH